VALLKEVDALVSKAAVVKVKSDEAEAVFI
jgi:hypothetical protein